MRALLTLVLLFANSSYAFEFGTGMAPGMQCPYPYNPAQNAYSGNDEIQNLKGNLNKTQKQLATREAKLKKLNDKLRAAKEKMRKVIKSKNAMDEIERHWRSQSNPESYSQGCGRGEAVGPAGPTGSAGSSGANLLVRPGVSSGPDEHDDVGRLAVPSDYCRGRNDWKNVVDFNGRVKDLICDAEVPLSRRRPDEARSEECRDGLEEFYVVLEQKEKLEDEARELKKRLKEYNKDKERIQEEIAEGKYCATCNSERRGQNNQGAGNFALFGAQMLSMFNNQQQRPQQPVLVAVPRRGAPAVLPYSGTYNNSPRVLPFPGPAAYPAAAYQAPFQGYNGIQPGAGPGQGYYGGAPGGVGQGAFGCQGTAPYSFGNPLARHFDPFNNSQANPFVNPYNADPFAQNSNQHPLLNPGYGPGIMPYLGNGSPQYAQYNPNDPFNVYGGNGAPNTLPYPAGSAFGAPGSLPYASQYGGSPYGIPSQYSLGGPNVLPYQYGNTAGGYSPPFAVSPVSNYNFQMNQLRQNISVIGAGTYQPPAVLPYLGSGLGAPVYTMPSTRTPVNAPPVLPYR